MTAKDVVAELKKFGNAQTKKTWMNHGAQEPCLGVKVEDMKKIQKRVKMDYQLALDLYDTGIADAMYLAGLIADDAKMTKKDLQKWIEGATWGMVAIKEDADLDLAEIKSLLARVAKSIHQQPNRVKYVMNSFVIAVACYVKPLHKLAVDTANGIGKVAVELVGACKIPFAPDHIKKFAARSAIGKKRKSPKC